MCRFLLCCGSAVCLFVGFSRTTSAFHGEDIIHPVASGDWSDESIWKTDDIPEEDSEA